MNIILHITTKAGWQTAVSAQAYRDNSLDAEGFIHCSTPAQVLFPANAIFQGQHNLILLCIDPDKLTHQLVYEDCYESGIEFPHLYGPLNMDAVVDVVDFPPNEDGTFSLPAGLKS
ncbi:MAG: DUF952 domain-containing protein [Chloroflexi bacterium]|nr:MAG: DUF952 domain-containing protein [Chloroflexota bacterium]